ncbi:hypothetical protein D9M68_544920 [compost metagenome]
MTKREAPLRWRYSLRGCLPHRPCPGRRELVVRHTRPRASIPSDIPEAWKQYQSQGYGVCLAPHISQPRGFTPCHPHVFAF